MFGCPRCGNDAVYLADEVVSLIRCEFCGDAIDADVLLQEVDHISRGLLPEAREELLPPLEAACV
jgi:transcription elongation factor Elf1